MQAGPSATDEAAGEAGSYDVRPVPQTDTQSVAFISLGCPKNLVDSETMLGTLSGAGFRLVSSDDEADVIVINTCGFLEASKDESVSVIQEAIERKEQGEVGRVVVAGCLVQRHRAKLLEWAPGIDAMIGVFDRDHVLDAVRPAERDAPGDDAPPYWITGNALQAARDRGLETVGLTVHGKDGRGLGYVEGDGDRYRLTPRHWAYLRVSEGCNQRCAFCTIPSIRGKMRSKPIDDVVREARSLLADGAFELNLIGQDTTSYGYDIGYDDPASQGLVGLLRELDAAAKQSGSAWIRLMYAYPTNFTDRMIDALASLPNIVKYIDIPLQHGSDRMLDAMRRGVTAQEQRALLDRLRDRIPGVAIRTTFITGFPGETDDDHAQLRDLIEDFGFDMMGVFRYSREEGTRAGTMDEDPALHVPDEVKFERERDLMELQQSIAYENAGYLAEQAVQFDVLIDAAGAATGVETPGVAAATQVYAGRAYFQAPQVDSQTWVVSEQQLAPGELVRCTIVDSDGYDLVARPTEELERSVSLPILS